jgi:hypothetical protein
VSFVPHLHFILLTTHATTSGSIELMNFPLTGIPPQRFQTLTPPTSQFSFDPTRSRTRQGMGAVRCMEWSSDGYVLATGWELGWGVWTVGGRCVSWGWDVDIDLGAGYVCDGW